VLPLAGPEIQRQFEEMLRTRDAIEKSVAPDDSTSREMTRQLDYVLEKFLLFTYQIVQWHAYLVRLAGDRAQGAGTQELVDRLMQQLDAQVARLQSQQQRASDDATARCCGRTSTFWRRSAP